MQEHSTETFNVHGFRLAVHVDQSWIREGVREALRAFAAPIDRADGAMRLMGGAARPTPGRAAPPIRASLRVEPPYDQPPQFRFGEMSCYRSGSRLVYSDGFSTIIVDPAQSHAEGTLCWSEGEARDLGWRAWRQPVFTFSLLELLRHHGLYHLHAAAVERAGHGILLAGDSGSGKTTLTLLLARAGWQFLSDDAVLLRATSTGVEARALPTPFHVDPALASSLPELAGLAAAPAYNGGPKRELFPERVYGQEYCPAVRPAILLMPRVHEGTTAPPAEPAGPGIWLRRLSAGQAVAELIRTSALVLLDERAAAGHLESLRLLATGCVSFRLYHGPGVLTAPETFGDLMDGLLAEATRAMTVGSSG